MNINENTRVIDLKVSDLITILKESTPTPIVPVQASEDDDEIGGYEVAERATGYARQTCYQLKSEGKIPYIAMPSGGVRFSRKEILSWLMSHKKLTKEEVEQQANDFVFKRKLRRK
jgi:predicted DNA-binding transcriptional regulator AlpA